MLFYTEDTYWVEFFKYKVFNVVPSKLDTKIPGLKSIVFFMGLYLLASKVDSNLLNNVKRLKNCIKTDIAQISTKNLEYVKTEFVFRMMHYIIARAIFCNKLYSF